MIDPKKVKSQHLGRLSASRFSKFLALAVQGAVRQGSEVLASSPSLGTTSLRAVGPGSSPMDHRFPFSFPLALTPYL